MTHRATRLFKTALLAIIAVAAIAGAASVLHAPARARHAPTIHFDAYEPQKAVYHVTTGGGWFGREHKHLLTVLNNHMNAVGAGFLDLYVVMQGDGLDLLLAAKSDPKLAEAIDRLKKNGAHFEICYNTLVQRQIDPFEDLYGVQRADIVGAGIAEVTHLVARGFVYLHL